MKISQLLLLVDVLREGMGVIVICGYMIFLVIFTWCLTFFLRHCSETVSDGSYCKSKL